MLRDYNHCVHVYIPVGEPTGGTVLQQDSVNLAPAHKERSVHGLY